MGEYSSKKSYYWMLSALTPSTRPGFDSHGFGDGIARLSLLLFGHWTQACQYIMMVLS